MTIIKISSVNKLLKSAGAQRKSREAVLELAEALEDRGKQIAFQAITLARHSGRKTVNKEDIKLAST